MVARPIFSYENNVTIQGDHNIHIPQSFGSLELRWKKDGIQFSVSQGNEVKIVYAGTEEILTGNKVIPWPPLNQEQDITLWACTKPAKNFGTIHVRWTENEDKWNGYRSAITDKGELFLAEIPDKYRDILQMAENPTSRKQLDNMKKIADELDSCRESGIVNEKLYQTISSHWKSEIYNSCILMMAKNNVDQKLISDCADFISYYLKRC